MSNQQFFPVRLTFRPRFQQSANQLAPHSNLKSLKIERVQFLFNNATNQYVTYEISDQNEMLHRYIDSFGNTGHNMVYGDQFRTNAGFGIGMDFDGSVDLSNQQFSVQLDSSVDATKPVNIYLYFHSVMSI